jgi:hypothetical protein
MREKSALTVVKIVCFFYLRRSRPGRRSRCGPEPLFDAGERLANFHDIALVDRVEPLLQKLEFERGMKINFFVALGAIPVQRRLAILPHHDDGRGIGSLKRQRQIEQDRGVRIPG